MPKLPPERFVVRANEVNVRSTPETTAPIVRTVHQDEEVALRPGVRRVTPDGWVWRRMDTPDVAWIAEWNEQTGQRLLAVVETPAEDNPAPPSPGVGITSHTDDNIQEDGEYIVHTGVLNVRDQPDSQNGLTFHRLRRGERVQIVPGARHSGNQGWVWREITAPVQGWVAELNQITGQRLLRRVAEGVTGRVQADGSRFLLDNVPLRFIGANLRELAFYGTGLSRVKHTRAEHRRIQLGAMAEMGMTVVRFHACHKDAGFNQCLQQVGKTLDMLDEFGLLGIVVLNDSLGHSGFYVQGERSFHEKDHHLGHLDKSYFLDDAYQTHYFPFIDYLTPALQDHRAIFAWELGNEFAIHPQPATAADGQAFLRFARTASARIRDRDPQHLITTGLLNSNQVRPAERDMHSFATELYNWPYIDFGTVHFYQDHNNPNAVFALEEERSLVDLEALKSLGKPLVVEEFSATVGDRARFTNTKLEQWFGTGIAGFMQWGLSATRENIGVGDTLRGMDRNFGDWDALFALYKSWASERL